MNYIIWAIVGVALAAGYWKAAHNMQPVDVVVIAMGFTFCFALGGTVARRILINQLYPKEES